MRVALIALHFAEYSAHLALAIAEQHPVLLVLYRDNAANELGDRLAEQFAHPKLTVLQLDRPRGSWQVLKNARQLLRSVRDFRADVLHLQDDLRDELVLALARLPGLPKCITIHDPSNHAGQDAARFRFSRFRLYRAWVRARVDGAFAHGQSLAAEIERQCPKLAGRTFVVHHGPIGLFDRRDEFAPERPPSFLFFGRIHAYKGLHFFIQAILRLRASGLDVRGVIAGRGSDVEPNRAAIEQNPAAFELLEGYVDEATVRRLFRETTAAVLPYVEGTQSGVAAMALGYGRPVVASAVGAIPELVRDGLNGLLVPPGEVAPLSQAMQDMASDASLWRHLADGALALRDGELSWRECGRKSVIAYEKLLNCRAKVP